MGRPTQPLAPPCGGCKAAPGLRAARVLGIFLRLGCTSFGGPIAHLGFFRAEFVTRRRWLGEAEYADLVALCQSLPGPASSQVAACIGLMRAGLSGLFAAWLGFTLPSAAALILFAYGTGRFAGLAAAPWLHGLKIVAVAVVAQALWGMARTLCPDRLRATIAIAMAVLTLALPSAPGQIGAIILGGLIGWRWIREPPKPLPATATATLSVSLPRPLALAALFSFAALLAILPLAASASGSHTVALISRFYRAGALVFGGGHVVLPLLQQAVVPPGWIGNNLFLAGYGAVQAVPGPLFTFAAYLGTAMRPAPNGWLGGLICLVAIYFPSFLLLIGVLPFWDQLRRAAAIQSALRGVNAAVVGLLLAALYTPVWTSAITTRGDFAIGIAAFLLLAFWRAPPWLVVLLGAAAAQFVALA